MTDGHCWATEVMRAKLRDPDDKVRAAACAVLASAELETLIHHVDVSLLKELAERTKDKKVSRMKARGIRLTLVCSGLWPPKR